MGGDMQMIDTSSKSSSSKPTFGASGREKLEIGGGGGAPDCKQQ